jgi:hypothetical protein
MEATSDLVNRYEKGMIYKLCCKDANITEIYIGSTINKNRRKCQHKKECNNQNRKGYNFYVYQFIRDNGGFGNWDLVILEEYPAENKNELVWKEREWIEKLKPSLNSMNRPVITTEEKKEKISQIQKKYRQNNLEKYCANQQNWCKNNPEKVRQITKKYRENNPEKVRQLTEKWRENNSEKIREYYKENSEKISEKRRERVNCDICNQELARASLSRHKKRIHNN